MDKVDLLLTSNLDLRVVDNTIGLQADGETTLLSAMFTDARVGDKRGYWIEDIQASEFWTFSQRRAVEEEANEMRETAKALSEDLEQSGLYDRIDTDAFIRDDILTLEVKAYDNNQIKLDRIFAI